MLIPKYPLCVLGHCLYLRKVNFTRPYVLLLSAKHQTQIVDHAWRVHFKQCMDVLGQVKASNISLCRSSAASDIITLILDQILQNKYHNGIYLSVAMSSKRGAKPHISPSTGRAEIWLE
jgi:hypothetical protein